ncbi:MAG: hypothetical protein HYY24_05320 [Verrucomicrobia bacterium]|nr:hypothetical protein [Verrucomicrobiota bacterium]
MNAAHLHLMLNHLPVLGIAFGLLLLGYAVARKSNELRKVSLAVFVLVSLLAVPAYLTGEPAEDLVARLPDVPKAILEQHEEVAQLAFTGMVLVGVASAVGLVVFRRGRLVPAWFNFALLAAALLVTVLMAWTANLGGQIRHTEIRAGWGGSQ